MNTMFLLLLEEVTVHPQPPLHPFLPQQFQLICGLVQYSTSQCHVDQTNLKKTDFSMVMKLLGFFFLLFYVF